MLSLPSTKKHKRILTLTAAILLFFYSCSSVRLIQEYDEITDEKIALLQEKTAGFFVKMERQMGLPESAYEKYIDFYDEVKAGLNIVEVRNRAIPKSEIVQQQIKSIQSQFMNLEKLHKLGFNSYEEIVPAKNAIENSFASIIQFQMALKSRVKLSYYAPAGNKYSFTA